MQSNGAEELMLSEQRLEQYAYQKRQFHSQLTEAKAALEALRTTGDAYKIIGNLMVKQTPEGLRKELEEREETLRVRIASIEKQEEKLQERSQELRQAMIQQQSTKKK